MTFPTIPTVAAGRILFTLNTAGGATKTFPDLSSLTKQAGDLLIAICVEYDGNSTNAEFSGWGGGFTEFADFAGTTTMAIGAAYKFSTGSETGTFTVTTADTSTNDSALILMSIPGAHPSTAPEAGGFATGTTTAANPAAFDPAGWAAEDTLWIAVSGSGEDATTGSFTGNGSAPTNYTGYAESGITADVVGGVGAAVAFRQLNAASEDVGSFAVDTSNARNAALVIAVRPDPAAHLVGASTTTTAGSGTLLETGGPTRQFAAASFHFITTSPGTTTTIPQGARTFAAIVRVTAASAANKSLLVGGRDGAAANQSGLIIGNTGDGELLGLQDATAGFVLFGGRAITVADSWVVVAATKAAGTATPRGHEYSFAGASWAHSDAGVTVADLASSFADLVIGDSLTGRVAVVGVFPTALSDANIETLDNGLQAWLDLSPAALWRLDQATVTSISDLTGGGANQSGINGTTVSGDGPPGFNWTLGGGPVALAGTSTTTSAGSGALWSALAGASTTTTATAGTLWFQLAGTSATTTAGAGALRNLVAGTSTTTTAGSGTVSFAGQAALAGTSTTTTAGSGTVGLARPLAGSGSTTTASTGTLTVATMATVEVGAVRWTVVAGELAGVSASITAGTGALATAQAVVGPSTTTSVSTGALALARPLVGTSSTTTTSAGTLAAQGAFAGASVTTTAGSGALLLAVTLAGTSTTTTAGSGALGVAKPIAGTSVTTTGNAAATIGILGVFAGLSTTTSAAAGTLALAAAFGGTSVTTAASTGTIGAANALAGASTTTTAGSGTLRTLLAGTSTSTTAGSGTLGVAAALAGTATTTATSAGTLRLAVAVAGVSATAATGAGSLGVLRPLAGTAATFTAASGVLVTFTVPPPRWLEGATAATGTVEGGSSGSGQVEGVLVGAGIVEGNSSL